MTDGRDGRDGRDGLGGSGSARPPDRTAAAGAADGPVVAVDRWLSCDHAWIDGTLRHDVAIGLSGDRIVSIRAGEPPATGGAVVETVDGLVLPGLVDAHSHCFHRALRGRTHADGGTFWTWRTRMYELAAVLEPDTMRALARGVLAEQAQAGVTTIGEFHYVHHRRDGDVYDDPNALGVAVLDAANDVGVRVTLLDTLYLTGDVGRSVADPGLDPVQRRFSDRSVERWATRVGALAASAAGHDRHHVGAALHSVRAVPPEAVAALVAELPSVLAPVAGPGRRGVLHAHVAEQRREVDRTRDVHGRTPIGLLADTGALDAGFTAVHGVWLDDHDVALLAAAGATVCACPTTERDLADGVVAGDVLADAGIGLALGSDQHGACDLFEEARALELDRRLVTGRRGLLPPSVLLTAATRGGATSLGWSDTGRLAVGELADLCVVDLDSTRLAGVPDELLVDGVVHAATGDDVDRVMVGGRWIVQDGRHVELDVADELRRAIAAVDRAANEEAP